MRALRDSFDHLTRRLDIQIALIALIATIGVTMGGCDTTTDTADEGGYPWADLVLATAG